MQHHALVERSIGDLIPTFLNNRQREVEILRHALVMGDFELVRRMGHRMRGVGGSYGFEYVTLLGQRIEQCGRERDADLLGELVSEYSDYLSSVRIDYA
ncbi:MAG TPA: Hpt domain-containing protein [Burkholderiales bacterium]|nr:Hpt domain-containing protein [Burkholderiales bacterium]